jgi:hypothetical protein
VFGAGRDMTNYYGVGTSHDGRWLVVSASEGTAPRTDVWLADLRVPPARPDLRAVAVGLDAEHGAWVGRDGRLYVHTDLDAPRGRLCVADPEPPRPPSTGSTWSPRTRRPCWRTSRCSTTPISSSRCCWSAGPGTPSASWPCTGCSTAVT